MKRARVSKERGEKHGNHEGWTGKLKSREKQKGNCVY
jgi:hypothetical protein